MSGPVSIGGYTLLEKLGEGGMGAVWLALDPRTGARRALKVLTTTDTEMRLRFAREGEAMARVDGHPNLLRVHSAGEDRGRAYLVMDVASGGTLSERLRGGRLPPSEVVALGRTLASALAHVHARGVLHRDLKPSNVLFDEAGAPKLADFGLARPVDHSSLTASGTILGTPAYMAPEQADGRAIDERGDVYALGAIIYHMATGRAPYAGGTALAVLSKVLTSDPPAPSSLAPDLPLPLDGVIRRAMARDPAARFQTAAALAEALAAAPVGNARPRERPGAGLALVVVSCAVVTALVLQTLDREEPAPLAPAPATSDAASTAPTTTAWSGEALEALVLREDVEAVRATLGGSLEPATRASVVAALALLDVAPLPTTPDQQPARRVLGDFVTARTTLTRWSASAGLENQDGAVLDDLIRTAGEVSGPPPLAAAARVCAQRQIVTSLEAILHLALGRGGTDRGAEWLRGALERARLLAPDGPSGAGLKVLHAALCFAGKGELERRPIAFAAVDGPELDDRLARATRPELLRCLRAAIWLTTAPPLEAARRPDELQAHAALVPQLERPELWKNPGAVQGLLRRVPMARSDVATARVWLLGDHPAAAVALREAHVAAQGLEAPDRHLHEGRLHALRGDVVGLGEAIRSTPPTHLHHLLQAELDLLSGKAREMLAPLSQKLNDPRNPISRDAEFWRVLAVAHALAGDLPSAFEHLAHARQLGPGGDFLPWRMTEETERLLAHLQRGGTLERSIFPPR